MRGHISIIEMITKKNRTYQKPEKTDTKAYECIKHKRTATILGNDYYFKMTITKLYLFDTT